MDQSLDFFICRLAKRIDRLYPSNCSDVEDYIQVGHLKLAEIHNEQKEKRDFKAYAIVAVSRAMRDAALGSMCAASAPRRIKKLVHTVELSMSAGKSDHEICDRLKIGAETLYVLKSLINAESWHRLFSEPTHDVEQFSLITDILSSCYLSEEDRTFIKAHCDGMVEDLGLTNRQRRLQAKSLRQKLIRSGYGR